MSKTIITSIGILGILAFGTMPFLFLLWDHPFVGGTPDVTTFAQHAKTTIESQTLMARAEHGYFTAIQLFPLLILQTVAMSLVNGLPPILNLWLLQHLSTFAMTALFFLIGRRVTRSTLGGILCALSSVILLDAPIFTDSGFPRFLSTFVYSKIFFLAFFAFSPQYIPQNQERSRFRILFFIYASAALLSHHHFGPLRLAILCGLIALLYITKNISDPLKHGLIVPQLQSFIMAITLWIACNYTLVPFFVHNFLRSAF